jgi:hypothetical protein
VVTPPAAKGRRGGDGAVQSSVDATPSIVVSPSARRSLAERLVAVGAGDDELGDQRVVARVDRLAVAERRVDPDPGAGRRR